MRLANELNPRIADLFCTAVRIELGLPATPEGADIRGDLYETFHDLGQASAILYRQILEATPNFVNFKTMASVSEKVLAGVLGRPPRPGKRRK